MRPTTVPPSSATPAAGDTATTVPQPPRSVDSTTKRVIRVVEAEEDRGNIEYKRQVQSSPARLRSLATQMSFRLDEGHGTCIYRIGVEDDGCHSLLTYEAVAESARLLECIARSLNAIVTERVMVQDEICSSRGGSSSSGSSNGSTVLPATTTSTMDHTATVDGTPSLSLSQQPTRIQEAPMFDMAGVTRASAAMIETTTTEPNRLAVTAKPGVYTRAELHIHRVETHLLDPSPISLTQMARCSTKQDTDASCTQTHTTPSEVGTTPDSDHNNHNSRTTTKAAAASAAVPTTTTPKEEDLSVGETLSTRNIRIAVVGNVDAGKSTLIGTLTTSCLDDGRGKSRTSIMKHRHEIESGRTSTATTHLLGFRSTGEPIAGRDRVRAMKRRSEDEIARESYRVVTLMDLAGHEKYLKTTIHGVSSGFADHALILVNARHLPTHMTQHHLNLCCSYGIPVIVVFTKTDGCPEHAFESSREAVKKMLRSPEIAKKPYTVRNRNDIAMVMDKLHVLAPMIETSCVSGAGIELLQQLLFSLPKRRRHEHKAHRSFEFLVEDIFFNVPGVGAVVSGFVNAGALTVGSSCHVSVGPTDDGRFLTSVAKSAQIARINTSRVTSGQSACLALSLNKEMRKKLRRGMVVLREENPTSARQFDAEICVLRGEGTTIRKSYQAYVHILNVRQSAFARHIEIVNHNAVGMPPSHNAPVVVRDDASDDDDDDTTIVLRPGSRAKVRFEFAKRPEYIRPGMRMLFRDGRVRGVGIVTSIPMVEATKV